MFHRKWVIALLGLAALMLIAPNVFAQRFDRATKVTINQPFKVAGTALPAGTYVIRLMDVASSRNVVQILNEDETKSYGIVMGISDYRFNDLDKPMISFNEARSGVPVPMRSWFYPGYNSGVEFVYPKYAGLPVAQTSAQEDTAWSWQPEYIPEPGELDTESFFPTEPAPAKESFEWVAAEPQPEAVVEPAAEPFYPESEVVTEEAGRELPKTATPYPLMAIAGLLAAGAAEALRMVRKRG